jgi:hypothetical protein
MAAMIIGRGKVKMQEPDFDTHGVSKRAGRWHTSSTNALHFELPSPVPSVAA